jgi:cell division protein FtsW
MNSAFNLTLNLRRTTGIWIMMILLGCIGILAVYSSSSRIGSASPFVYLSRQFVFLAVGFAMCYVVSRMHLHLFRGVSALFFWSITILWWIMQFWAWAKGISSPRTVQIPYIGSFQPAEFAKLAVVMYLSHMISAHQNQITKLKFLLIRIIAPILCIGVPILFSNFSTLAIIALTSAVIMWLGGVKMRHLLLIAASIVLVLRIGMFIAHITIEHNESNRRHKENVSSFWSKSERFVRRTRLATMDSRWSDYKERLFHSDGAKNKSKGMKKDMNQIDYAYLAIAAGGILPQRGPGNSEVKYMLPEAFSDFIFAIVVEEYGLLFAIIFVLVFYFLALPWIVGVYVKKSKIPYATLLMSGFGILLSLQTLIHVFVSIGLLPVTGQNLPLVSHGGSSIITTCIMYGIIMNAINYVSKLEQKEQQTSLEPLPVVENDK